MNECNKHLWHMPLAPENLLISCMTCGKKLLARDVNIIEDLIEKLNDRIYELEQKI
jgi:hypothetical protein